MFSSSDSQLVKRAQSGDGAAYEALHQRHFRAVWQYLYRHGLGRDDADDLSAEAFVRAYRALPDYRCSADGSFLPFLIRISANLATDCWRKRQVELESSQQYIPPVSESVDGVALRRLARQEDIARVRNAIRQLPESDRQIIALCYEQELTGAQVAEILDKPTVSAVTSHLNRALNRLRTLVQKQERRETLLNEHQETARARGLME